MIKRLNWFVGGLVAGAVGVGMAKRKVKAKASELTPAKVVRAAAHRVGEAVAEGRRAMRVKEAELRARADGTATMTLADELDPLDVVLVDGEPIEPGKVIVLRQARDRSGQRRRTI